MFELANSQHNDDDAWTDIMFRAKEYAQLAEWLKELKYYRKQKQKAMNQWALS